MYNLILLDLKSAENVEDLYLRFKAWKKCYNLSLNQCKHILIALKDYRPDFINV